MDTPNQLPDSLSQLDKRTYFQIVPTNLLESHTIKSVIDNADYYIIKVVLILTTAIVGIGFLVFAVIHVWKFLRAALN